MAGGTTPPLHGNVGGDPEHAAGTPAPETAVYESVNLFGRRTGYRITVAQGEILPILPRGFTWTIAGSGDKPEA